MSGRDRVINGVASLREAEVFVARLERAVETERQIARLAMLGEDRARGYITRIENQNRAATSGGWSWGSFSFGFVGGVFFSLVVIPAILAWAWGF